MKKLTVSLTAVLMMVIMVLPSIGVWAGSEKGKAEFSVKAYAELSVQGGRLDCDFGAVDSFARVDPICRPSGKLVVKSNTNWRLTTVKTEAQPVNFSKELINVLRVTNQVTHKTLVDFGTAKGSITGSDSTTIPVQYELRAGKGPVGGGYLANLDARSGQSPYAVTVVYTLSAP